MPRANNEIEIEIKAIFEALPAVADSLFPIPVTDDALAAIGDNMQAFDFLLTRITNAQHRQRSFPAELATANEFLGQVETFDHKNETQIKMSSRLVTAIANLNKVFWLNTRERAREKFFQLLASFSSRNTTIDQIDNATVREKMKKKAEELHVTQLIDALTEFFVEETTDPHSSEKKEPELKDTNGFATGYKEIAALFLYNSLLGLNADWIGVYVKMIANAGQPSEREVSDRDTGN